MFVRSREIFVIFTAMALAHKRRDLVPREKHCLLESVQPTIFSSGEVAQKLAHCWTLREET